MHRGTFEVMSTTSHASAVYCNSLIKGVNSKQALRIGYWVSRDCIVTCRQIHHFDLNIIP